MKKIAAMIQDATAVRFDASDLMPGAVGAGSFWKDMTSWVSGSMTDDQALKEIDAPSRPRSKSFWIRDRASC